MQFPNESPEYRQARQQLLQAEIQLREQAERVAELRRGLPAGGGLKEDYVFTGPSGAVPFSALFTRHNTLMLYNFMFSAEMANACPMCSSFLDGVNANAAHLKDRIDLAVVAKSPWPRLEEFARRRGWHQLPMFSSADNTFNVDYHGQGLWQGQPSQNPMLHVFVKDEGKIRHFWSSEMHGSPRPGGDPRHLDMAWPLWSLLDCTPSGRGTTYPSLWKED